MCPNSPMTTSTRITPQQNLLSTIYKQSWHPVASIKQPPPSNYGLKRPKDTNLLAENFQKPLPFQSNLEYNHSKQHRPKQSGTGSSVKERYRENSRSNCSDTRLSIGASRTYFTTRVQECDAQSNSPSITSLATWKKQLKTCVESNMRDNAAKHDAESRADRTKNATDRILNLRRQQLYSADSSSAKCYRILNYQNSTLASICVQGSDPPVKSRLEAASRSRSHSASSSLCSALAARKTKDSNAFSAPINELADCNPVRSKNKNATLVSSRSSSTMETDEDLVDDNDDDIMQDEVFSQNEEGINSNEEASKIPIQNEMCVAGDSPISNFDLLNLNFSKDETDISDNESDISEQEMSSDGEDGVTDSIQTDERSRMVVEKYKELYKNENISEKKDYDTPDTIKPLKTKEKIKQSTNKKNKIENEKESPAYEFAPLFPKEFHKYNLRELSILPYDVNWRDVVKISDLCPDRRPWKKGGCASKQRRARFAKAQEERNRMESMVDRLLILEKLQAKTRQSEYMSRFHISHIRAAAARLKSQNAKTAANPANNDNRQNGSASEPCTTIPRTPSRRRSSVPLASARLAWANEITRGEHMKEAHRSGDFSAVIHNWSATNRPTKNNTDKSRRSSDCNIKKSRSRWMHPRFYEYHWSEKSKDDKVRPTTHWSSRLRSCSTCKEKWRKITSMALQKRRRRPSTASSMSFNTVRPPTTGPEKTFVRPRSTGFPLPASPVASTSSNLFKTSFKSKPCVTEVSTNSSTATASNCYIIKEHTVAEQTRNISISRHAYLTSAFRVTSAALSKRPQTTWSSS